MIFKQLSRSRQGELFVLFSNLVWSFFPVITILTFNSIAPLFSLAFSTLVAALFFSVVLTLRGDWKQMRVVSAWPSILLATLFIGVIYYALYFLGISRTTAGNASITNLFQVFSSMAILRIWGKEVLTTSHIIGAVLIVFGAFIILFQGTFDVNTGSLLIIVATFFTPVGNYFQQRAREKISSAFLMFIRSLFSGLFLLALALFFLPFPSVDALKTSWVFILINGFLLLGLSKLFFIESIHRIPITKSLALGSVSPLFTIIIAFFVLKEIPTLWQLAGFFPMFFGVLLLTDITLLFSNKSLK